MCAAVDVSSVQFFYSKKPVLKDINLIAPYGKIYSLLGPSGAGKTTLLRLILGRIKISHGQIKVFENKPGQYNRVIGYMPQDSALCPTFTVGQTLKYFANLFRLSKHEYIERVTKLRNLFGLPNDNELISELSGGQQKLVSLCIVFIQNCRLMILDEPTVGSDPTLGDSIWKYLHTLCREEKLTVILVTHYIEEAARAHLVGIMRDGKILEEGSPEKLIVKYQQKTLEDVFLHLCMTKDVSNEENESGLGPQPQQLSIGLQQELPSKIVTTNGNQSKEESHQPKDFFYDDLDHQKMNNDGIFKDLGLKLWILMVLIKKNLSIYRNINISWIGFLIPAVQVFILCTIIKNDNVPIPVAVYNAELDPDYSIKVLNSIEKVDAYFIQPIPYDTLDSAIEAVKKRKVSGAIEFSENFTDSVYTRYFEPDYYSDEITYNNSNIKIYVDYAEYFFTYGFMDSFRQSVFKFLQTIHAEEKKDFMDPPVQIKEIVYAEETRVADYLLPGFLIWFLYFSLVVMTALPLILEKKDALFERSLLIGVSHELVLVSHFCSNSILSLIQIILMFSTAFFWFNMKIFSPIWEVFVLVEVQAFASIATGILLSSLLYEESHAFLLALGLAFPQLIASSAIVPKEFMPMFLRKSTIYLPTGIPSESLRNSILRGWSILHPEVYQSLIFNLVFIFIFIMTSIFFYKRNS